MGDDGGSPSPTPDAGGESLENWGQLRCYDEENAEAVYFPLRKGENIIGRSDKLCNIVLPARSISDVHAKITLEDDFLGRRKCWIKDLGSVNGFYLNDKHIAGSDPKRYELLCDCSLRFGYDNLSFSFELFTVDDHTNSVDAVGSLSMEKLSNYDSNEDSDLEFGHPIQDMKAIAISSNTELPAPLIIPSTPTRKNGRKNTSRFQRPRSATVRPLQNKGETQPVKFYQRENSSPHQRVLFSSKSAVSAKSWFAPLDMDQIENEAADVEHKKTENIYSSRSRNAAFFSKAEDSVISETSKLDFDSRKSRNDVLRLLLEKLFIKYKYIRQAKYLCNWKTFVKTQITSTASEQSILEKNPKEREMTSVTRDAAKKFAERLETVLACRLKKQLLKSLYVWKLFTVLKAERKTNMKLIAREQEFRKCENFCIFIDKWSKKLIYKKSIKSFYCWRAQTNIEKFLEQQRKKEKRKEQQRKKEEKMLDLHYTDSKKADVSHEKQRYHIQAMRLISRTAKGFEVRMKTRAFMLLNVNCKSNICRTKILERRKTYSVFKSWKTLSKQTKWHELICNNFLASRQLKLKRRCLFAFKMQIKQNGLLNKPKTETHLESGLSNSTKERNAYTDDLEEELKMSEQTLALFRLNMISRRLVLGEYRTAWNHWFQFAKRRRDIQQGAICLMKINRRKGKHQLRKSFERLLCVIPKSTIDSSRKNKLVIMSAFRVLRRTKLLKNIFSSWKLDTINKRQARYFAQIKDLEGEISHLETERALSNLNKIYVILSQRENTTLQYAFHHWLVKSLRHQVKENEQPQQKEIKEKDMSMINSKKNAKRPSKDDANKNDSNTDTFNEVASNTNNTLEKQVAKVEEAPAGGSTSITLNLLNLLGKRLLKQSCFQAFKHNASLKKLEREKNYTSIRTTSNTNSTVEKQVAKIEEAPAGRSTSITLNLLNLLGKRLLKQSCFQAFKHNASLKKLKRENKHTLTRTTSNANNTVEKQVTKIEEAPAGRSTSITLNLLNLLGKRLLKQSCFQAFKHNASLKKLKREKKYTSIRTLFRVIHRQLLVRTFQIWNDACFDRHLSQDNNMRSDDFSNRMDESSLLKESKLELRDDRFQKRAPVTLILLHILNNLSLKQKCFQAMKHFSKSKRERNFILRLLFKLIHRRRLVMVFQRWKDSCSHLRKVAQDKSMSGFDGSHVSEIIKEPKLKSREIQSTKKVSVYPILLHFLNNHLLKQKYFGAFKHNCEFKQERMKIKILAKQHKLDRRRQKLKLLTGRYRRQVLYIYFRKLNRTYLKMKFSVEILHRMVLLTERCRRQVLSNCLRDWSRATVKIKMLDQKMRSGKLTRHVELSKHFLNWSRITQSRNSRLGHLSTLFVKRWSRCKLSSYFQKWSRTAKASIINRSQKMELLASRRQRGQLSASFLDWNTNVKFSVKRNQLINRRHQRMSLSIHFREWSRMSTFLAKQRRIICLLSGHRQRGQLLICFRDWRRTCKISGKRKRMIVLLAGRRQRLQVSNCFRGWSKAALKSKFSSEKESFVSSQAIGDNLARKRMVAMLAGRRQRIQLSSVFWIWSKITLKSKFSSEKKNFVSKARLGDVLARKNKQAELNLLRITLVGWRKLLLLNKGSKTRLELSKAFHAWVLRKGLVDKESNGSKRTLSKCKCKENALMKCFKRIQKQMLLQAFYNFKVSNMIMKRKLRNDNRKVKMRTFLDWKRLTEKDRFLNGRLKQRLTLNKNKLASRVVLSWRSIVFNEKLIKLSLMRWKAYSQENIRRNKLLYRVIRKMMLGQEKAGFNQWRKYSDKTRQLQMYNQLKAALEKSEEMQKVYRELVDAKNGEDERDIFNIDQDQAVPESDEDIFNIDQDQAVPESDELEFNRDQDEAINSNDEEDEDRVEGEKASQIRKSENELFNTLMNSNDFAKTIKQQLEQINILQEYVSEVEKEKAELREQYIKFEGYQKSGNQENSGMNFDPLTYIKNMTELQKKLESQRKITESQQKSSEMAFQRLFTEKKGLEQTVLEMQRNHLEEKSSIEHLVSLYDKRLDKLNKAIISQKLSTCENEGKDLKRNQRKTLAFVHAQVTSCLKSEAREKTKCEKLQKVISDLKIKLKQLSNTDSSKIQEIEKENMSLRAELELHKARGGVEMVAEMEEKMKRKLNAITRTWNEEWKSSIHMHALRDLRTSKTQK